MRRFATRLCHALESAAASVAKRHRAIRKEIGAAADVSRAADRTHGHRISAASFEKRVPADDSHATAARAGQLASRIDELNEELASRLHELWRTARLRGDGSYEPRPKTTSDADWIAANGTDQLDIANTTYRDLPKDFQRENLASAKVAMPLVHSALRAGHDLRSADFLEEASRKVHVAWLDRNRDWAEPEQLLPYHELSEAEKEKDRVVVRAAVDLVEEILGSAR